MYDLNSTYKYKAVVLPSSGVFAIGSGSVINSSNLTAEYFIASGLPNNYKFNVTFNGFTQSGLSQIPVVFEAYSGTYSLNVYSLQNSSLIDGEECTTYYTPSNFNVSKTYTIDAGIPVTIDYSSSTACYLISTEKPVNIADYYVYIFPLVLIILILLLILLFLRRRKTRKGSSRNKTKNHNNSNHSKSIRSKNKRKN